MKSYLEGCNLGYSGLPTPMGYATGRRARLQPAPEQRLPAADACAFALAKGGFGRPCGLYEHVPEFPLRLAGIGVMDQRQRSVQVIVQRRRLVKGLSDPAYTRPARAVRDMRKSSVFNPDTQC